MHILVNLGETVTPVNFNTKLYTILVSGYNTAFCQNTHIKKTKWADRCLIKRFLHRNME
jgi:hypothetical protein